MRRWWLLGAAVVLVIWGWFVLGFLTEPSAVGNLRVGLIVIGAGSLAAGVASAITGVWMLVGRLVDHLSR
jgi:hypothetical protein